MRQSNQKQEHTNSYYAASVTEVTNYPILKGARSADICVVGAGFTGVATALTLAERGYSVALVEGNRVGWGASGRNGGQLIHGGCGLDKMLARHGDSVADMIWEMKWRGNDIIRERIEKYAIACDLKDGFAEVANRPKMIEWLHEYAADRRAHNAPESYEIWDREQTRANLGTDAFHGAFVCYRDGHLHPLNLCIGEARAAHGLGTQIFEHSPVIDIEHGARPRVTTEFGHVEADAVILCGNAYSDFKGLSNLVFPAGSYIIATEPLSEDVTREINPKDVAVCDLNEVVDYYRLSADRRLLYGGACNYSGRDPRSIRDYILPRMLKIYPQLKNVRVDYEWGGKIGIVLNRQPTVGCLHGNVYYCQGYSGHGVAPTHTMSEVMADAVTGSMERYDLFAGVRHFRIPGSQWVGNQIIALGMMYYKMMDRLG
ncbi:MAG: FAD-binding oxidoreductase [Woeseiaceae bacterium]